MQPTTSTATPAVESTKEVSQAEVEQASLIGNSKSASRNPPDAAAFPELKNHQADIEKSGLARIPIASTLPLLSAVLLILSFPDFNLWPLAWFGFVPLLVTVARSKSARHAFFYGWFIGTAFFYVTCYWLTYSMVHYGGLTRWQAYLLLAPGPLVSGLFPALFSLILARVLKRWGTLALLLAPVLWVAFEWMRLSVTGQLWNAIGYSQAFHPALIQAARFGGVYAVGFLIIAVNAAIAYAIVRRSTRAVSCAAAIVAGVLVVVLVSNGTRNSSVMTVAQPALMIVALQPNVPMDPVKSAPQIQELMTRHLLNSERALSELPNDKTPRLLIWPESPMNFSYGTDSQFRDLLGDFARQHHTAVLFNSQEPAGEQGFYNSALLVNEEGQLIAQYDKIRLMPFGEYVPLPGWLPGSKQVRALVGEFTPGTRYVLMPLGKVQAGVFICIESAYPWIARTFTGAGADVLINISNDGYLGPTAVMRQHLSNTIFRAVENGRPLLRVTNTGISGYVLPDGEVKDATPAFQQAARTWPVAPSEKTQTFYTLYGDLFAGICTALSLCLLVLTFRPLATEEQLHV